MANALQPGWVKKMNKWYVIYSRTGSELDIAKVINRDMGVVGALVPRRELRERKSGMLHKVYRTLFPGYVFINAELTTELYYRLLKVPGTIRLLGEPTPLYEYEMERILALTGCSGLVERSSLLLEGSHITVSRGPLVGLEGQIKKLDKRKGRAKVELMLFNQPKIVELSIDVITKSEQ